MGAQIQRQESGAGPAAAAGSGPAAWFHGVCLPALFFAVIIAMLAFNVRRGPDNTMYLCWSKAAVEGDIEPIHSPIESPTGLPLTQWSTGPGLAAAPLLGLIRTPPMELVSRLAEWSHHVLFPPLADAHAFHMTAACFVVLIWLALARLFLAITDGKVNWTVFGLVCAFSGTHLGYYSLAYGSELVSLAPMALLAVELARPMRSRLGGALLVGSCTGMLIMTRPYLALYAAPVLAVSAIRAWRNENAGRRLLLLGLLTGIPALGVGQVALVNHWMTGDWRVSPYSYGDGDFKSLDFAAPEIAAVLTNPLHGLFPYHPMYLIGFVAMTLLVFRAPSPGERALWGAFVLVVAVHTWIQGAWYHWWMATGVTFGMRGMAITGVVCMAAIVRLLMHLRSGRRGLSCIGPVTVLLGLAGGWSWLLMTRGPTDYLTYAELLASQASAPRDLVASGWGWILVVAGICSSVALGRLLAVGGNQRAWSRLQQGTTLLLATLALAFLAEGWIYNVLTAVNYGLGLLSCFLAWVFYRMRHRFALNARPMPAMVGVASSLFFALMVGYFVHMAIPTQRRIVSGNTPQRVYEWKEAFLVNEVQGGYGTYQRIPGFEEKKRKLAKFLEPFEVPRAGDGSNVSEAGP